MLIIKLEQIIARHLSNEVFSWLKGEANGLASSSDFRKYHISFVMMPRRTGKRTISLFPDEGTLIRNLRPGFTIEHWSIDRLCRVWLTMNLPSTDRQQYFSALENLFVNAEMNELVALYSALPVLAFPEQWKMRCAEGIRNNIAQVLESIMCDNPYPAEQLETPAWNQLVLKAIFTDKPLLHIYHLRERSNPLLAESISMFAHERWAAGRQVNPLVWICVADYVNDDIMKDITRLAWSTETFERKAAALVCHESDFPAAKALLKQNREINDYIEKDRLTWNLLQEQMDELKNTPAKV